MKKLFTALMIALPLTACDASKELREENQRLMQENQDLKIQVARLEERAKPQARPVATTAAATPAKPKPKTKSAATKAPEDASPAEKAALIQAATGGGSVKSIRPHLSPRPRWAYS